MNIIIPLAGKDERFDKYGTIKPLIEIGSKPLIKHCTDSMPLFEARHDLNFIVLEENEKRYGLKSRLEKLYSNHNVKVNLLKSPTEGAACTVLTLKDKIDNKEPLIIYLADIYFESDLLGEIQKSNADGLVPTFKSNHPKYSYLKLANPYNSLSNAVDVAEKTVISDNASAGLYYFRKGSDFVWAAEQMIKKNLRVNNMFYICPVYKQLVGAGKIVKIVPSEFKFGLGSPEEIELFKSRYK